jgi:O-acetyl-ADP-ribose deacetylase (regulator of RNase III)
MIKKRRMKGKNMFLTGETVEESISKMIRKVYQRRAKKVESQETIQKKRRMKMMIMLMTQRGNEGKEQSKRFTLKCLQEEKRSLK